MRDIGLFLQDDGTFDLQIEDGDLKGDGGLETAVSISLFSDRRVTDEELPQGIDYKRGFWGDMFPDVDGDQLGSKLWTLIRSKRTVETLRRTEDYAREALRWMVEDGIASSIEVSAAFAGSISEGRWVLNINIVKPLGQTSRFQVLWDQQKILRG